MQLKRRNMKHLLLFFILSIFLIVSSCKDDTVSTNNTAKPCETNNTATVKFENRSNTNTTYDIIWDGSKVATVVPGSTSEAFTVSAVQHTMLFKVTNTNTVACNESTPTPAQCSEHIYWCTY